MLLSNADIVHCGQCDHLCKGCNKLLRIPNQENVSHVEKKSLVDVNQVVSHVLDEKCPVFGAYEQFLDYLRFVSFHRCDDFIPPRVVDRPDREVVGIKRLVHNDGIASLGKGVHQTRWRCFADWR